MSSVGSHFSFVSGYTGFLAESSVYTLKVCIAPRFPSSVAVKTDESIAESSAEFTIENSMAPQSTVRSTIDVVTSASDH